MILFLLGCHGGDSDSDAEPLGDGPYAVVATTDYSVGALALIDLQSLELRDAIASTSSDPAVVADGEYLFVLEKYGFDAVRWYRGPAGIDFSDPVAEIGLEDGANPVDAKVCGDSVVIAQYGLPELAVYGLDGTRREPIDLSAYADADGIPEIDRMVRRGDRLYVSLNRLEETGSIWPAAGPGNIVVVECGGGPIDMFETGPNAQVRGMPGDADRLLVRTGVFYDADQQLALDGGVEVLTIATGAVERVLDEATLGVNISGVAVGADGLGVYISQDTESNFHVDRLDSADWSHAEIATSTAFLADVVVDDRGRAFVASGQSWIDVNAPTGVLVLDGEQQHLLPTLLPPASITLWGCCEE